MQENLLQVLLLRCASAFFCADTLQQQSVLYSAADTTTLMWPADLLMKLRFDHNFLRYLSTQHTVNMMDSTMDSINYGLHDFRCIKPLPYQLCQERFTNTESLLALRLVSSCPLSWLAFFAGHLPVADIVHCVTKLGFTIILQPTISLTYLGTHINVPRHIIQPTVPWFELHALPTLVCTARVQNLQCTAGYVSLFAWTMNWPYFMTSTLCTWDPNWINFWDRQGILCVPHQITEPHMAVLLHFDTVPTPMGALDTLRSQQQCIKIYANEKQTLLYRWPQYGCGWDPVTKYLLASS
jgi:hypothetical protein